MYGDLVSAHELEYLARKHNMTVERVKEILRETASRSRGEIEAALNKHFTPSRQSPQGATPV
jgi:hypothetical protein